MKYSPSEWTLSCSLTAMSFLSSSISSSSLSSSSSTSPLCSQQVFPTYLPTFAAHSLYAAILANPVVLHAVKDLPLFHEDLICQELVCLFHDVSATQHYHSLSTPHDLPVDFSIPLGMLLASLPDRILSILHLHGFHTFIEQIPPAIIYPTFWCIFLTMTMEQRDHYISKSELPPHWSPSLLPVPAPNSPTLSLLAQLSSPAPSDTSSSLTTIDPEYGLDEDAVSINRYFIMQLGNNCPVISASYRSSSCFHPHRVLSVLWYRPLSWRLSPLCLSPLPSLSPQTSSDSVSVYPMWPLQSMGT